MTRLLIPVAAAALVLAFPTPARAVTAAAAYSAHLTRAPYLTDLVANNVAINFATDQSAKTASVRYGSVSGTGDCTPTTSVATSRVTIKVGSVSEYQWTARVSLHAAGSYCYRVYLGSTDLLNDIASPRFTSQVPAGSTAPFAFDVLGDWGQVDGTGANTDQANLMGQMAASGARFAVTVGDNGYPNGSQINYGDLQQTGANTSAIFGPGFWTVPGASLPLFTAVGNHGIAGPAHTDITTWTQSTAVSSSGGRYQNDVYCCVNQTASSNYGSEWYAFDAGNARFYVLDSAWSDTNLGTGSAYSDDAAAHFAPGDPEYKWLANDLQTHQSQLKFVFSHYPFYADNPTQGSDPSLQGAANLEGLLARNGVQMVFNGHMHGYERNTPSAPGMPVTYVTGGGGGTLEPVGPCTPGDAYAIGWSPTKSRGSACGAAPPPTAAASVFHFLKVAVSGDTVTVTPTDSLGNTFDVQTYRFTGPPDTYLDSAPPAGTSSTSATLAFHASDQTATFTCSLDDATPSACVSPMSYATLADGPHTFTVAAAVGNLVDPTPAQASWTVDTVPPSSPGALTANAPSPFEVDLSWTAATDDTGVTGYHVYRDGSLLTSIGPGTSYADMSVAAGSTHQYALSAFDLAGNVSPRTAPVSVTTPSGSAPLFQDGFESGNLSAWSSSAGLVVQRATVHSGGYAAEAKTVVGTTYAKRTLPGTYQDGYARIQFDVISQSDQINLLRLRTAGGTSLCYLYVNATGRLGVHDDALGTNTLSTATPAAGWHSLELRLRADDTAGTPTGALQVWLDGALVTGLSSTAVDVGATPIGAVQIGDTQSGRSYDVVFDDVAFGTGPLGQTGDTTAPSVPANVTASAAPDSTARVGWDAATDDVGVSGYDVFRDGTLLASLGPVTAFTDSTVAPGKTYAYAVRARDAAGNLSALSPAASVTMPDAAAPVFADGFESGDLSAWTSSHGLVVGSGFTHSGTFAAEGNTTTGATYARRTLPTTYADGYARVAFLVRSQTSQINLLRLRAADGTSIGYVYLDTSGRLAVHVDAAAKTTTSTTKPGGGWHVLELHFDTANGTVELWLDGAAVSDLGSSGANLGTAPIGALQIGETTTSRTYDVVLDDAAFGTSRIGVS